MWNHAQNCSSSSVDGDTNEMDSNIWLNERIEKSLDLSQYLKYLDQLFAQATSESESSDSDEGEQNRTFTEFRQPVVSAQPQDRPQFGHSHNHLLLGPSSSVSNSSNHVHSFSTRKQMDSFHVESNISSSSLSSIDSGTSSLHLSSSETSIDTSQNKNDNNANGVSRSRNIGTTGTEEEQSTDKNEDKGKKSQKKKKASKRSSETFHRQHKPSSGGKGNHGSKGGGGGSGGSSSNDNSGSSSGSSSSSSQSISGNNSGSPGAKSRSGKNIQKQTDSQPDIISATEASSKFYGNKNIDYGCNVNADLQGALGLPNTDTDSIISNGDLVDNLDTDDTLDSSGMSLPLNSILDNISYEEASISDFISMSTNSSPSSSSQFSTHFFSKIAESAATSTMRILSRSPTNGSEPEPSNCSTISSSSNSNTTMEGKKRKKESHREQSEKVAKLTEKQKQSRIDHLNAKRRKIYVYISRREIGKAQKIRATAFKEGVAANRKLAQACARQVKKNAIQSQKCMKESVCKAKRLTQEMEAYWKSVEKCENDLQRKVEKEAEEKLKKDVNVLNKIRNGKLNCLITQIEFFINKLLNKNVIEVSENCLVFDEVKDGSDQILIAGQTREKLKANVHNTIERAVNEHRSLVKLLDMGGIFDSKSKVTKSSFHKTSEPLLRNHQIFGINWIKSLYNKGLNGILADESGLGKRVQVAGFLSQLAEQYNFWGPFLIVCPSTFVSNWQHELNRRCSKFKVVSYCGKPVERKTIRQEWERNVVHTEDADFHIVITSYQLMTADLKYFSKTKWQYLVMDDSQNIITSSTKWIALLSFRCRNKLLLCGNPRLNSLRHLCSYLYFVIPSLFDSQQELSEWLLVELESSTLSTTGDSEEVKSSVLKRLQAALQNFLVRRELKDVEFKTTQCEDTQLNCALTKRQQRVYSDLLKKADLQGMLAHLERCGPEEIRIRMNAALNLSFQLRKACNHPNLIEERDCLTPFWMTVSEITLPQLIFQTGLIRSHQSPQSVLERLFNIYSAINIYTSMCGKTCTTNGIYVFSAWSFLRLLNLSWKEAENLFVGGYSARLDHLVSFRSVLERVQYDFIWLNRNSLCNLNYPVTSQSEFRQKLVFTSCSPFGGLWRKCKKLVTLNTIQYRNLKSRNYFQGNKNYPYDETIKDGSCCSKTSLPTLEYPDLLQCYSPAVYSRGYKPCILGCEKLNQHVLTIENRVPISELDKKFNEYRCLDRNLGSTVDDSLISYNWSPRFLPDHDQFVSDSCKMNILDELLASLKQQNHHVLVVSYMKDSLTVLEEYLKTRRYKYVRLEDTNSEHTVKDVFVYLMYAHSTVDNNFRILVNTVVFFDHDWYTELEHQKDKVITKLEFGAQVNYYRIICNDTIEERMTALGKERNTDLFENKDVAPVSALKDLLSILMGELDQEKDSSKEANSPLQSCSFKASTVKAVAVKEKPNPTKISKVRNANLQHGVKDYTDVKSGFNSTFPVHIEDNKVYIDDEENGRGVTRYPDDDKFSLSFDEGYMGMSPDSFEDLAIKLDYEEHSTPKRAKMGRGSGKRGRPLSRVHFHRRDLCDGSETFRRGPGRPRIKTVGPANQGTRGRKPGRPPMTKKAETISSGLTPLSSGQNVFGFYSSPDLELS